MVEGEPLIWAGQTALKFYGRVAVDENYNGLALDESEGDRIASVLGDKDILFIKNHGVMVCAPNIAEAWDDLYYLEWAAEVQLRRWAGAANSCRSCLLSRLMRRGRCGRGTRKVPGCIWKVSAGCSTGRRPTIETDRIGKVRRF